MLLRFEIHLAGRLFAEVNEAANLVAQFGKGLLVGKSESLLHTIYIV